MDTNVDKVIWLPRIRFALASLAGVALLVLFFGAGEMIWYSGDMQSVSGATLRKGLGKLWPPGLDGDKLANAYVTSTSSIDSSSMFLCFDTDLATAQKWREFLRQDNLDEAHWLNGFDERTCETRESETESIPFHRATGAIPEWWLPSGDIRAAFETMVWYDDSDSGVARGKYLQFDERAQRCWIFTYTCQHDLLWPRGEGQPVSKVTSAQP